MQKIETFVLAILLLNSITAQTTWDDFDNPENIVVMYSTENEKLKLKFIGNQLF